jgi:hypothetical protein
VAEVRGLSLGALLLAGCTPVEDSGPADEAPWVAPSAPPWLAIAGNTYDGALKSTCAMSAEFVSAQDGSAVGTVTLDPADGGSWAGVALGEGVQVKATLTWSDCENTPDGDGSFPSNSFSGEPGDLFVLYYNGVGAGFEWMEQAVDHLGGAARVQFVEGTSDGEIDTLAETLGLSVAADPEDATFRTLSWTDDRNVAEVLASCTANPAYAWGEPTWVAKPGWW